METPSQRDISWLIRDKYGGLAPDEKALAEDIERLAGGEPLAYVIGWIPFLGLKIYLDSKPLIPRPETEWWTEQLIAELGRRIGTSVPEKGYASPALRALDLCAGSGAIGCALLATDSRVQVSFGEIAPEHEATIRKSIRENGLDASRTDIRTGDLFEPFAGERFDTIAANPPYIPQSRALPESVSAYEPEVALRSGEDGLDLIRRIATEAPNHLNPGGELWLECDAEHAEAARALVAEHARRAELRTDPYGRARLVVGYYG